MCLFILIISCQPPPLRVMLLGARGSGKTEVGRLVASKLGVFHVAFRDYLQEQLLVKMKKPPLMNEDEWDPGEVPMENGEDEEKDRNGGANVHLHVHDMCILPTSSYIHVHV